MKRSLSIALLSATLLLSGCASDTESVAEESAADQVAAATESEAAEPVEPEPVETTEAPEPPPPPATINMPIGSTITVETEQGAMDVQVVETKVSKVAPDEYSEPPVNGAHLGVLIQYLCKTGTCDYNPFDWGVRGPDGTEYNQAYVGQLFGQDLQSGTLQAGVPAKGWVSFDVPTGPMSLEYRANLFDDDVASWTAPVS